MTSIQFVKRFIGKCQWHWMFFSNKSFWQNIVILTTWQIQFFICTFLFEQFYVILVCSILFGKKIRLISIKLIWRVCEINFQQTFQTISGLFSYLHIFFDFCVSISSFTFFSKMLSVLCFIQNKRNKTFVFEGN